MNHTSERLYGQLGRATYGMLIAALSVLVLTVVCALLGLPQAVISFREVAISLAYAFVALLTVFLVSSLVMALIRWMDRRSQADGKPSV